jgi:D-glycero-alpha-D-manno-heptose-7-phosphate kinase
LSSLEKERKKMRASERCLRLIHSRAPLRINDIGGWTDTWFAREGWVLNLAIVPAVEAQIKVYENREKRKKNVLLHTENYGQSFWVNPCRPSSSLHPLLQHIIARVPPPPDLKCEIIIFSPVPAGISTGTSASVSIALIGGLLFLNRAKLSLQEIISLAHRVETEDLKMQSGVQDQVCAAYGGICFIHMPEYPRTQVEKVSLQPAIWNELDRRLCLIYLGKPHLSSAIHEKVIAKLERAGSEWKSLERMKKLAAEARSSLLAGNLDYYGEVMIENNECQRALLPELISPEAEAIIQVAKRHWASGWKVNGAGGRGGSLTILAHVDDRLRRQMLQGILSLGKGIRPLPASLSQGGLVTWEAERSIPKFVMSLGKRRRD